METFNFSVPQDITVGKGSLSKLPEIAKKLGGKHALIISGPHLEKMGLVKKAADYLASVDIKADTFTDIEANPSVTTVEKATAKYLESGADFIVAFGGGSPMDVANAVLLPVIAEYNALADHGKYLTIYNDISPIPAYADEFEPMMLVDAIRELCTDIGIPENLTIAINNASKTGTVTKEEIESRIEPMAVDAMKSGNIAVNPRTSRQCDIEMLYRRAL